MESSSKWRDLILHIFASSKIRLENLWGEGEVYIPVAVIFRCSVCRPFIFICSVMKRQQKIVVMSTLLHMQLRALNVFRHIHKDLIEIRIVAGLLLSIFFVSPTIKRLLNVFRTREHKLALRSVILGGCMGVPKQRSGDGSFVCKYCTIIILTNV